jgi:hypothetical protein
VATPMKSIQFRIVGQPQGRHKSSVGIGSSKKRRPPTERERERITGRIEAMASLERGLTWNGWIVRRT